MEGFLEIHSFSYPTNEAYVKHAEQTIKGILTERLRLLGIGATELQDISFLQRYNVKKGKFVGHNEIREKYEAMGINLVEICWDALEGKVIIKTPTANPDYNNTRLAIQYIKQRPKN